MLGEVDVINRVKFRRIANALVTSFVVGVSPVLSVRCRKLYDNMYGRLLAICRNGNPAVGKRKISFDDLILAFITFLFLINGILWINVVTTQDGKALGVDHIRNFKKTFPNHRGQCTQGYELNTLRGKKLSPFWQIVTLTSNIAYRLVTGSSVHRCRPCDAGSSKVKEARSCSLCHPGQYQPSKGSSDCVDCPAGSYQPAFGAAVCDICPAGFHQPVPGGWDCVQCPEFTYQPRNGSRECLPCSEQELISDLHQCGILGKASRDSPLVCALDRCQSESIQQDQLITEQQEHHDEDGFFFSGYLPTFDKLRRRWEEEMGGAEGTRVKEEFTEESQAEIVDSSESGLEDEITVVNHDNDEEIGDHQKDATLEEKEDELKEKEDALKDDVDVLEMELPTSESDSTVYDATVHEEITGETREETEVEVNLEEDQSGESNESLVSEDEPEVELDEMSSSVVVKTAEYLKSTMDENGNEKETLPVKDEIDDTTDEQNYLPENNLNSMADVVKEESKELSEIDSTEKDRVLENHPLPSTPQHSPPTRSSDHPILQKITEEISENNKIFDPYIPVNEDFKNDAVVIPSSETVYREVEEEKDIEVGSDDSFSTEVAEDYENMIEGSVIADAPTEDIAEENIAQIFEDVSEDGLDSTEEDVQVAVKEVTSNDSDSAEVAEEKDAKIEKLVYAEENSIENLEQKASDGPEVLGESSVELEIKLENAAIVLETVESDKDEHVEESDKIFLSDTVDKVLVQRSAECDEVSIKADEGDVSKKTMRGCDIARATREWISTGNLAELERLQQLLVSQFDAIRHHGRRVFGSELHLIIIPIALSILLSYCCLMGIALHMLVVTDRNFLTMASLLTDMVFLASFTLLEDDMRGGHVVAAVLLVLSIGFFTASLRVVDQISKAFPIKLWKKIATMMILTVSSVIAPLLFINCELMTSKTKYWPLQDETILRLLCVSKLLSIPSVLIRIDCEVAKSPLRTTHGVHVIDLILETIKFVLAMISPFSETMLQLVILSSTGVAIQSTQQLLCEVLFSSVHVTSDHVTGEEDDVSDFTEVRKLIQSSSHLMRSLVPDKEARRSVEEGEENEDTIHLQQILEGGIEIDKRELTFDRGRLHSNRNIVAYINRRPAEEMVSFNSESECKLYLAQMTGSCESLESILQQVRRDSEKSESSNEDYIIIPIPKIVVECGDQQRKLEVDCLCVDSERYPDRRRCKSADSCRSHSSPSELARSEELPYRLLDGEEDEDRRCYSSLSSFGNGSCLTCRKTKL
ncbi:uncharacterized protein LOC134821766 isoform X2 [Bolinopsis microptera]|uniref:uncharacterized protein LOC134821766 isoform X2 n=2 Tax=Bolinopsis microptera TaxID=2820187 RepID=UPI00307A2EF0